MMKTTDAVDPRLVRCWPAAASPGNDRTSILLACVRARVLMLSASWRAGSIIIIAAGLA